jgi:FlaA1/EpsC-like NDP-sugar epimerase
MAGSLLLIVRRLALLPRSIKKALMVSADTMMMSLGVWLAFALRLGEPFPDQIFIFWWLLIAVPLLSVPVFVGLGLYRAVVRFMGLQALVAVVKSVTISALIMAVVTVLVGQYGFPRSVLVLYWLLALVLVGGSRLAARSLFHCITRGRHAKERVIIYGAGAAGVQSASALMSGREYSPVAFVDDDPVLQGQEVHGIRVHSPASLEYLADRYGATQVLLAMPSVGRSQRRRIISDLEAKQLHVKTLPGLADLVSGHARVNEFRDVDIGDLLGRDAVEPRRELLEACIRDKVVMVTGAGGSIGSELARQIVRQGPTQLLLYEVSEFNLYRIERELRAFIAQESLQVDLVALLGSVANRKRLERVMTSFRVDTVYHAAAYKHVPMVEQNLIEAVRNNVFGTWHCAEAAVAAGVESFVLISTDKAVRPTNMMGATKRLGEMVLQAMARRQPGTRFTMVRFGNVLGSSGSVVPLFREQIRQGGPVTVTHPEVTRYFMTIPEAAELVLQAGSMGTGGDVFVLDMGEPVKILDLAKRMIHLMGLKERDDDHPDGDVDIRFVGLRPGEKLYEELLIGDNVEATAHPMIRKAREEYLEWDDLADHLRRLDEACREFDCGTIRAAMVELVSGYPERGRVIDQLWVREHDVPEADGTVPAEKLPAPTRLH